MELIIKDVQIPEAITFNYEELKAELIEKIEPYKNLVYTEEQISLAKKDVADLRRFDKALSDTRISKKKEYLKPLETFEAQIKELSSILNGGISNIDMQVKNFETAEKEEKRNQINEFFIGINPYEWLMLAQIFEEKWLNKSVKMASVEAEIKERLQKVVADLNTLADLPEFSFEATEEYKTSLDINRAISEGKRLAEIQRRKAEQTAAPKPEPIPEAKPEQTETIYPVEFRAYMTRQQMSELKQFFESRNINFERI